MTEMLQKTENVAKNVANENSQDLTEQWKKGELPEGRYWVKIKTWCEYITMLYYTSDIFLDGDVPVDNDKIIEVLAPVPSYEELQNMNKAVNECMAANIKLVEQNAQFKELLKECKTPLEVYNEMFGNKEELLTKIDEVLK
jgi:hypothetical protein